MINQSTINMFFPRGCTICNGKVNFIEDQYLYKCEECGALVSAHRYDSSRARKYEPKGNLMDEQTHDLSKFVLEAFKPLYLDRVTILSNGKTLTTSLINIIFKEYCMEVEDNDGNIFCAYFIEQIGDKNKIFLVDTGEIKIIEPYLCKKITNRGKSYMYLAMKMGMKISECKIKMLNYHQLQEAYRISHNAVIEAKKIAYEKNQINN